MPRPPGRSGPASLGAPTQRLPVNPRRNKVPTDQRKRVATACNNCNVRRVKCSGDQPCLHCQSNSRECVYPLITEKVSVPRSELDELRRKIAAIDRAAMVEPRLRSLIMAAESATPRPMVASIPSSPSGAGSGSASGAGSVPAYEEEDYDEGRLLHDGDGGSRYLGETSGATFLDNLRRFMVTIQPIAFPDPNDRDAPARNNFLACIGKYQTHDSRPIPFTSIDDICPVPDEIASLLPSLSRYLQNGSGSFPSGGLYYWGDMTALPRHTTMCIQPPDGTQSPDQLRESAYYKACLALILILRCRGQGVDTIREGFFMQARKILGNPLDTTRYKSNDIAALGIMALYLIEHNRRDAAYMVVANALHIAIMHGVHCGYSVDEQGKRAFWSIYILDRWLSCVMGRPPTIMDEVIRIDMPEEHPELPSPLCLLAHIELSRISGFIVAMAFSNARGQHSRDQARRKTDTHVGQALKMLQAWRDHLPHALRLDDDVLTRDRAVCGLHMAFNQLVLLTIRPILFMSVRKLVADCLLSSTGKPASSVSNEDSDIQMLGSIEDHEHIGRIRDCNDAARRNLRLARHMWDLSPDNKLTLMELHSVFNAATILLLHQIVFVNLRTKDIDYVAFGTDMFDRVAATGSVYAKDCSKVLHEMIALVERLRRVMFDTGTQRGIFGDTLLRRRGAMPSPGPGEGILSSLRQSPLAAEAGVPLRQLDYQNGSPAGPQHKEQVHRRPQSSTPSQKPSSVASPGSQSSAPSNWEPVCIEEIVKWSKSGSDPSDVYQEIVQWSKSGGDASEIYPALIA